MQIDMMEVNQKLTYTFLCGTSCKRLHVAGEALKQISYVAGVVEHDDDSLSVRNQQDGYVLNPPIPY